MSKKSRRRTSDRRRLNSKTLSREAILGQQGINLIERVVLEMGCRWSPTAALDVGIDGIIELCDRATRAPLNLVLHVQSKATGGASWLRETDEGFDYTCRAEDLTYWVQGNAPVLLIVSRPSTNEVYWVSVKDYFQDSSRRSTRRVHFDKNLNRFTPEAYSELLEIGRSPEFGLYLAPPPKEERLISNLLKVVSFGPRIFVADTDLRLNTEMWSAFQRLGLVCPSDWFLKDKRLVSFRDLTEYPWDQVCDRGTVEDFDAAEWALTANADGRRDFVWLLNGALRERLFPEVRFWNDVKLYAFTATKDKSRRFINYDGSSRSGRRVVFEKYSYQYDGKTYTHYRHSAMATRFVTYEGNWFLEVTPTYLYTVDGRRLYSRNAERLQGIKRLERQNAVRQQLLLWAHHLQRRGDLITPEYPYLSFGKLEEFLLDVGIEDQVWQRRDENRSLEWENTAEAEQIHMDFEKR